MIWSRGWIFFAALVTIVVGNAVALYGVYTNQEQETARLRLSEREFYFYRYGQLSSDSSDFKLQLSWREPVDPDPDSETSVCAAWLKSESLVELGFPPIARYKHRQQPEKITRSAFIVFEFDGPAYQNALQHAKKRAEKGQAECLEKNPSDEAKCCDEARRAVERASLVTSRLFVVDAGIDADRLHRQYPDPKRYAVVPGTVTATYLNDDVLIGRSPSNDPIRPEYLRIAIDSEKIYVPPELRPPLDPALKSFSCRGESCPGFELDLIYGARLEPWFADAKQTVVAKESEKKQPCVAEAEPEAATETEEKTEAKAEVEAEVKAE